MKLELLPNEILLDLFEYFDGTDLLRTFYGINSRFNVLLYKQFRSYTFQFASISKRYFDMTCQQHLPFITNQVIALELSNHKETPGQINLFFSYIPSLRQFIHLQAITLSDLHSYEILLKLLDECQHLDHFTRLRMSSCSFSSSQADFQLITNKMWSLPKLTNCYIGVDIKLPQVFNVPTIISTSIEFLTIASNELKLSQINGLLDCTPHLQYLSTYISEINNDSYVPSQLPAIIQLDILSFSLLDISKIVILFQSMPNLRHLSIGIWSGLINGHQWERIISDCLPNLKIFQLTMELRLIYNQNIYEEADELINSFRTPFWIDKHQWFVECCTSKTTIYLSTLTSGCNYFEGTIALSWESTYPQYNQQNFYNNITSIYDNTFFNQPISSNIRLLNINHISIKLPINDKFWLIVPNLDKLKSLNVSSHGDTFQPQLQTLFDKAPNLITLVISKDASLPLQISLFSYTNASICPLYLNDYNHCFNEEECSLLTQSPLGVQCEVLSIWVKVRQSIIHLVRNIPNLRSLITRCEDDQYYRRSKLTKDNEELIQWLKDRLPSTYLIVRDLENSSNILIWI